MNACVREMMWLGGWVQRASQQDYQMASKLGQLAYTRDRHIAYAVRWSFLYADAFGLPVSFSDKAGVPCGDWPDFYSRMLNLTLGVVVPSDFLRVIKEARKRFNILEKQRATEE